MTSASDWPTMPPYDAWRATCDTLHAHTQLLGKLAATLAPPEPQLQHAALRLTARGWETAPLPAPDGAGVLVVALDLHAHQAVVEHSDGRVLRVALTPHRSVGEVTRDVLEGIGRLVGPVRLNLAPQEVPWTAPLDEDVEHATYEEAQVATYLAAATRAAVVLARLRAPYRGRSSPVNAWWGTFDLAVSLFSGRSAEPPATGFIERNGGGAQLIEIGWWPGDARHARAAFYGFAAPAPDTFAGKALAPAPGGWDSELGEYLLDWDDVLAHPDPAAAAAAFGRAVIDHACAVCEWDPKLAASARGAVPPMTERRPT
ncbi:MAG TPA: DUF5996 family protein [Acidimicrobiales bacterium]|jgi:hypothetical protein|nr:DUF5996 family protein [Acidimicrobiales bacterium]